MIVRATPLLDRSAVSRTSPGPEFAGKNDGGSPSRDAPESMRYDVSHALLVLSRRWRANRVASSLVYNTNSRESAFARHAVGRLRVLPLPPLLERFFARDHNR